MRQYSACWTRCPTTLMYGKTVLYPLEMATPNFKRQGALAPPHPALLRPVRQTSLASFGGVGEGKKNREPLAASIRLAVKLPKHLTDKKRAERLDKSRGLLRLAHFLDQPRQRVQVGSQDPQDKLIIVWVHAVTG